MSPKIAISDSSEPIDKLLVVMYTKIDGEQWYIHVDRETAKELREDTETDVVVNQIIEAVRSKFPQATEFRHSSYLH